MQTSGLEQRIEKLCSIFNGSAQIHYAHGRNQWTLRVSGAHQCFESGSTIRHMDGTVEKMLAGSELFSMAETLEKAVAKLENRTIKNPTGYLISNQSFGGFSNGYDDEGPHIIDVYEGEQKIDSFAYDKERVRALLHKYAP